MGSVQARVGRLMEKMAAERGTLWKVYLVGGQIEELSPDEAIRRCLRATPWEIVKVEGTGSCGLLPEILTQTAGRFRWYDNTGG